MELSKKKNINTEWLSNIESILKALKIWDGKPSNLLFLANREFYDNKIFADIKAIIIIIIRTGSACQETSKSIINDREKKKKKFNGRLTSFQTSQCVHNATGILSVILFLNVTDAKNADVNIVVFCCRANVVMAVDSRARGQRSAVSNQRPLKFWTRISLNSADDFGGFVKVVSDFVVLMKNDRFVWNYF